MSAGAVRKLVTLTPELARRLDDYRFGERIASESKAMLRLIEAGLDEAERRNTQGATK